MTDASIEQEIQAKGKTAARVTPADIEPKPVEVWLKYPSQRAMSFGSLFMLPPFFSLTPLG